MNLTRGQLDRITQLGEQWSLLWDKRRMLWIAAEDAEDGKQMEEADLDVLLERVAASQPAGTMSLMEETGGRAAVPLRLRRAGRVIVLDPEDRVLLFRYDDGPPNGRHWCTPGGGLNDGEDYLAGARRELAEETGWTDVPLGPEVYERTLTMGYADAIVRQHERFFLARVEVARRGLGEVADMHVSDGIAAWHWWTVAELDGTDEAIWPEGLADLVREALSR